jgi:peptide/nickel transport system permease protein
MQKFLIKRLFQIILTLYIFATIVFFIVYLQPGDISQVYINNPKIPSEAREALKKQLGLDQPPYIQYLSFMRNLVTGNLGISFSEYPRPVWEIIKERLPRTVALFLVATLIYYALGFHLGKLIAWRRRGLLDYSSTVVGVVLFTVYTPWFAYLIIWIFGYKLDWFPLGKFLDPLLWIRYRDITANEVFGYILMVGGAAILFLLAVYLLGRRLPLPLLPKVVMNFGSLGLAGGAVGYLLVSPEFQPYGILARDILWHMVLPVTTVTLIAFGGAMLLMRDSMLEVTKEDYVLAAKAKGLADKTVRDKHAARNALLPMITSFVLALAFVVDGGIITETIFSWKGMGLTLLSAVVEEDLPLAVGTFVFTGIFALIAHLIADIAYAYLDPRIRYG